MAKGYTVSKLVAEELSVDLTAPQMDQCADLIVDAEAWIDHQTGRAWLSTSPTTDELHTVTGSTVYLRKRPALAIQAVKVRSSYVGATLTTLASTEYELLDAANGILNLNSTYSPGYYVKITYTSTPTVVADIQRAATLLVAEWMLPRLNPDYQGVESYKVASTGDEFSVKMRAGTPVSSRMEEVMRIVRAHEALVFA